MLALLLIPNTNCLAKEKRFIDQKINQDLIGQLTHLTHTQLNISLVVGLLSQFKHQPKEPHLSIISQVLHF